MPLLRELPGPGPVRTEYPIAVTMDQEPFTGLVNRVVLVREGGRLVWAHVLD